MVLLETFADVRERGPWLRSRNRQARNTLERPLGVCATRHQIEQCLLAFDVDIDRTLCHPERGCNVLHLGRLVAALDEYRGRALHQSREPRRWIVSWHSQS